MYTETQYIFGQYIYKLINALNCTSAPKWPNGFLLVLTIFLEGLLIDKVSFIRQLLQFEPFNL
jgi:hypothetical protein